MTRTLLTLTLAAQLAAGSALAQTGGAVGGSVGTDLTTENGVTSGNFGADWSATVGTALFEDDGITLRSETEIVTQWATLSEEDRDAIRRDCEEFMDESDDMTGTTGSANGSAGVTGSATDTTGTTGTGTDTMGATGSATLEGGAMVDVTDAQMEDICAAIDGL